ncbi:hypothetical protein Lal_00028449 [Lupinus albus]|nr:hypothetical protein Lal_00028449 [Lupinus albus]
MNLLIITLLIFSIASCNLWSGNGQSTFNVLSYGAKGDGHTDDIEVLFRFLLLARISFTLKCLTFKIFSKIK